MMSTQERTCFEYENNWRKYFILLYILHLCLYKIVVRPLVAYITIIQQQYSVQYAQVKMWQVPCRGQWQSFYIHSSTFFFIYSLYASLFLEFYTWRGYWTIVLVNMYINTNISAHMLWVMSQILVLWKTNIFFLECLKTHNLLSYKNYKERRNVGNNCSSVLSAQKKIEKIEKYYYTQ